MDTIRKLRSPWVIVTLLLVIYAGSYFAVGDYNGRRSWSAASRLRTSDDGRSPFRFFRNKWVADFYWPMTVVESKVRGKTVTVWYCNPPCGVL